MESSDEVLDPDALTIGFARRFATYKRGTLIFRDLGRLAAILNHAEKPVQFLFAGKAHPKDHAGKELIAQVVQFAKQPEFRRRIVFLEDYDMNIARHLVQGVDVWLNNPRRPLEASGTSGMKVCCNGGLNLSVLDGWWDEGYKGDNGFSIGSGEEYSDEQKTYQDDLESRMLYELLEQEITSLFYTRGNDGLPRGWIKRMKRSIATNVAVFNTHRMVVEYAEKCYVTSHRRSGMLASDKFAKASELAAWRQRVLRDWPQVKIENVEVPTPDHVYVGDEFAIRARVCLGALKPEDVEVQLFHGTMDAQGEIARPRTVSLSPSDNLASNGAASTWQFSGKISCRTSGQFGYCIRVLPRHAALAHPFESGLILWG